LEKYHYEGYLDILREIAANLSDISVPLLNKMKESSFLLYNINKEETNTNDDNNTDKLERASNIYLIDDTILQKGFNLLR